MTADRFSFQRNCVIDAEGFILNVGANEDPAGLRALAPERVLNCDIEEVDSYLGRPNRVDRVFDARETWPFVDDFAGLVVLGDILEHLYEEETEAVLREARRVSDKVCITVPEDDRFLHEDQPDVEVRDGGIIEKVTRGVLESESGYRTHCQVVTKEYLEDLLDRTGWEPVEWEIVDYGFVPRGHFVLAERK